MIETGEPGKKKKIKGGEDSSKIVKKSWGQRVLIKKLRNARKKEIRGGGGKRNGKPGTAGKKKRKGLAEFHKREENG